MAQYDKGELNKGVFSRVSTRMKQIVRGNSTNDLSVKDVRSKENVLHQGYLRKKNTGKFIGKAMDSINMRWKKFYVVITEKSIYYYKSDLASTFVGKFSLYGYNVVRRVNWQGGSKWPEFALVVEHASGDPANNRSYFFAATHQDECRTWMLQIRKGLMAANALLMPGQFSSKKMDSSWDISDLEDPIYPSQQFRKSAKEDDDIESDDSDYTEISDLEDELAEPPPRPRKIIASPMSPSTQSYIDFSDGSQSPFKPPYRPVLPPTPDEEDPGFPQHKSPKSPKAGYIYPVTSPALIALAVLEEGQRKIQAKKKLSDTAPKGMAPVLPVLSEPVKLKALKPRPPPVSKKPTQVVKPTVMPEKFFWNGNKEDGNRLLKTQPEGAFLLRVGTGGRLVLVISAGEGHLHSLIIISYCDGTIGLKTEDTARDFERFADPRDLVTYHKLNDIHLKNGLVQIKLKSPLYQCDAELI